MKDDELALFNTCSDLVALKANEAFPGHVLNMRPGEWGCVREICLRLGLATGNLSPDVFVSWLPDPMGNKGYSVILFYDESQWSLAAHYNRERLLGVAAQNQASAQPGVPVTASPASTPHQMASTLET